MVFYTRPSPSSIVRAWQAQLGPLDGRGFETPWVQKYAPPHSEDGSAPSLRVAASESASEQACRRLGVTQAASPRAARRTSVAMPLPLYYHLPNAVRQLSKLRPSAQVIVGHRG